jgi:hypothetical protein
MEFEVAVCVSVNPHMKDVAAFVLEDSPASVVAAPGWSQRPRDFVG